MSKKNEAKHILYHSIEEMLKPQSMSKILNRKVSQVTCQSFDSVGYSGSQLYWVYADEQRYVMKHLFPTTDWVALASDDIKCRSVCLWQYGVLDQLQPHIDHGIVAACQDADSFALLMNDVSQGVVSYDHVHTMNEVKMLLDALAEMHSVFWNDDSLCDPSLGLLQLPTLIDWFYPEDHNRDQWDDDNVWHLLFDFVDTDVRDALQSLMEDPQPLFTKLEDHPSTLIHGDYRPENFAIASDTNQIVLFDWQVTGYGSPFIDLHWLLAQLVMAEPFDAVDYYRRQIALNLDEQIDDVQWQSMIEVGNLADLFRLGWTFAGFAYGEDHPKRRREINRKSLASVNDTVRKALRWL